MVLLSWCNEKRCGRHSFDDMRFETLLSPMQVESRTTPFFTTSKEHTQPKTPRDKGGHQEARGQAVTQSIGCGSGKECCSAKPRPMVLGLGLFTTWAGGGVHFHSYNKMVVRLKNLPSASCLIKVCPSSSTRRATHQSHGGRLNDRHRPQEKTTPDHLGYTMSMQTVNFHPWSTLAHNGLK